MRHTTTFSVRYLTDDPVAVSDIIQSLQGIETTLGEVQRLLPKVVPGLEVRKLTVRVHEISQNSPLKEVFAAALLVAFQDDLVAEVPALISQATGLPIPDLLDTVVTVLALIIVFYGIGALRDLVVGTGEQSKSKKMLDGFIAELSVETGTSEKSIRKVLEERYADKTLWKRLANATSRFFSPSKRQSSAPMEVNNRHLGRAT